MDKVICDICGTSYPATADQCPICGYEKSADPIMDEEFDLHYVEIHDGGKVYHVDFDA